MRLFGPKLKKNGMYAVKTGDMQGGFIVWITEWDKPGCYAFLYMPAPMESIFIRKDDIKQQLTDDSLELVEVLPSNVYEVCRANFVYYGKLQKILQTDKTK